MVYYIMKCEVILMNDTIAAIATAQGVGAISIIRVSGEDAFSIVEKLFSNKKEDTPCEAR